MHRTAENWVSSTSFPRLPIVQYDLLYARVPSPPVGGRKSAHDDMSNTMRNPRNPNLPIALGRATALPVVLIAGGCGGQTVPSSESNVPSRFGALGNHALATGSHSRAVEYFDQAVQGYTEEMSRSGARMDLALDMANCIESLYRRHLVSSRCESASKGGTQTHKRCVGPEKGERRHPRGDYDQKPVG
jgi:hypothetical protein